MDFQQAKRRLKITPYDLNHLDEYAEKHHRALENNGLTKADLIAWQHQETSDLLVRQKAKAAATKDSFDAVILLSLALGGFIYLDRSTVEQSVAILETFAQEEYAPFWEAAFAYGMADKLGFSDHNTCAQNLAIDYDVFRLGLFSEEKGSPLLEPDRFCGLIPFTKKHGYDDLYERTVSVVLSQAEKNFEPLLPVMISLANFSLKNDPVLYQKVLALFEKAHQAGLDLDRLIRTDEYCCGYVLVRFDHFFTSICEAINPIRLKDVGALKRSFQGDFQALYHLDEYYQKERQTLYEHGVIKDDLIFWQHEALLALSDTMIANLKTHQEPPEKVAGPLALILVGYSYPDEACFFKDKLLLETLTEERNQAYWDAVFFGNPLEFIGIKGTSLVFESIALDEFFENESRPILGRRLPVKDRFGGLVVVAQGLRGEDLAHEFTQIFLKKAETSFVPLLPLTLALLGFSKPILSEEKWARFEKKEWNKTYLEQKQWFLDQAQRNGLSLGTPLKECLVGVSLQEEAKTKTLRDLL